MVGAALFVIAADNPALRRAVRCGSVRSAGPGPDEHFARCGAGVAALFQDADPIDPDVPHAT